MNGGEVIQLDTALLTWAKKGSNIYYCMRIYACKPGVKVNYAEFD
jgi:hypothetical protein